MLSLNVVTGNFVSLQKHILKQYYFVPLVRCSLSIFAPNQCQKCQHLQSAQLSTFTKKDLLKKNLGSTVCGKPNRTLTPAMVSTQPSNSFFNTSKSIKDRLYKWGLALPENYSQKQLDVAAKVLLNGIYMKVPYKTLRETAGLEDTYLMWTRIVYIHLWILICQLRHKGGRDGEILGHSIIMFLWEDVTERLKSFEEESETAIKSKKEVLQKAYAELCFFFLLLDEGLVSGDAVMASSLWTLIYSLNSYDAEAWHIENLVHYIRYTIARMQAFEFSDFVLKCESINQDWKFPEELLDSIKQENDNWS